MAGTAVSPDRRQHDRWPLATALTATLGLTTPVRLVDISPLGVRVECGHPLAPGQSGILDVVLPEAAFHLRTSVVWCQVYPVITQRAGQVIRYRAGLRFIAPPAAGGARLYALLSGPPAPDLRSANG